MSIKITPYLNFNGNAGEAIAFYQRALGAEAEAVMRFGEMPGAEQPPEVRDLIMHAHLIVGSGALMLSDAPPHVTVPATSNTGVSLDFGDAAEARRAFDALADGGTVTMPLQDTFWNALFGMVTDRFAIRWMVNCQKKS